MDFRFAVTDLFNIKFNQCLSNVNTRLQQNVLTLKQNDPIAVGKTRYVYVHPEHKQSLIKIHRRIEYTEHRGIAKRWFDELEDYFVYRTGFLRELRVYFDSRYQGLDSFAPYIAPIEGIVDTDLGIGLVCRGVFDEKGDLAPTLGSLIRNKDMPPERVAILEEFITALVETDLVVGDLNFGNVVLERDSDGHEKFYLIDGLGERTFFRIQTYSKRARQKRKAIFVEKVRRRVARITH